MNITQWLNENRSTPEKRFDRFNMPSILVDFEVGSVKSLHYHDDCKNLIPQLEDYRTVTIYFLDNTQADYIYTSNENNSTILSKEEFAKYQRELSKPVPASVFGLLSDDEIDELEEKLQCGILQH